MCIRDRQYIQQVDEILRLEFANAKSHTHLQFATAKTQAKIAKEYGFANAESQSE